jgi:hypothetical protein
MTYTFEVLRPDLQEGSPEAEKELQKLKGVSAQDLKLVTSLPMETHEEHD